MAFICEVTGSNISTAKNYFDTINVLLFFTGKSERETEGALGEQILLAHNCFSNELINIVNEWLNWA